MRARLFWISVFECVSLDVFTHRTKTRTKARMGSHAAALLRGLGHPTPDAAESDFKALVEWLEHTKVRRWREVAA